MKNILLLFSLGLVMSSCATIPAEPPAETEASPEAARPYLVPEGRAAWRTTFASGSAPDSPFAAFPWEWEQRIGSWSLVWKPIPFEARFQIADTPERRLGTRFNILGEPYYRSGDFNWSPFIELDWRERLNRGNGIATLVLINPEIRRSGDPFCLTLELQSGPYFQLGSHVWLQAHGAVRTEAGSPISRYLGAPPPLSPSMEGDLRWRLRFPLGFAMKVDIPGAFGLSHGIWGIDATLYQVGYENFSSIQFLNTLTWQFGS